MRNKPADVNPRVWVAVTQQSKRFVLSGLRGSGCRNPGQWNLFGGNVDPGESPQQALVRELFEETGLVVTEDQLKFAFSRHRSGKPTLWYTLPKSTVDLNMLKHTEETVDYEYFDVSAQGRTENHYSLEEYLQWLKHEKEGR